MVSVFNRMAVRIDLITLFPAMANGFLQESVIGRAIETGLIEFKAHNLRDWSKDKHHKVDDVPYGGGPGMLMTCQPLFDAVDGLATPGAEIIYLCPDGEQLTNDLARELAKKSHLILVSGHYEGIDQRFRDARVTREISVGDYVLTNGTLPACIVVDCVGRQIPGVLGEENSLTGDSYNGKLLAFPQYTRPAVYDGLEVPPVLLGGHHAEIEKWRRTKQIEKTKQRRPDLLEDK